MLEQSDFGKGKYKLKDKPFFKMKEHEVITIIFHIIYTGIVNDYPTAILFGSFPPFSSTLSRRSSKLSPLRPFKIFACTDANTYLVDNNSCWIEIIRGEFGIGDGQFRLVLDI